ncbi:Periplasmic subunit MlaD of the ABC-type intermembrane phospholipid transporter Mla (MlaD) (PDB:5UW8) [Commensalibacter communis]|uniref:outer membrane lipid asymmetry maintenance protein MlaD n=1 Tax=Commensalibacter communis TaxID=2972786 RepID=UPI0022FF78B3|nr:outer membrane lipid asymmetry maintenance protein MlaD [Commensalibacter communis]CAI3956193.1 Periplasmic subunit MlaD of the ABC-type intermembrane phospholipid transporter Mla (MlaD) (PDB:5UW8) [Commensalibacter communis]
MVVTSSKNTRQVFELITGFVVIAAFLTSVVFAIIGHGQSKDSGYPLKASFEHIDGLSVGSDVKLAGVTIGQVTHEKVNPKDFKATVTFTVRPDVRLPVDTAAVITSDSLLGGKYIDLSPGGDDAVLKPEQFLSHTQGSISLQELLSKFIFSVTDNKTKSDNKPTGETAPSSKLE